MNRHALAALPLAAILALTACGGGSEEPAYEADTADIETGEPAATGDDPAGMSAETPDTPESDMPEQSPTPGPEVTGDIDTLPE